METPFAFGKISQVIDFTDRKEELNHLSTNFNAGINTILISPRRWGKSSLVAKTAVAIKKKNKRLKCCFVDLFNVRTEEQFYQYLAQEVIRSSATKWEEIVENSKKFLGKFIPKISISPDEQSEISLSLNWKEVKKEPDSILNLAEKIALEKGVKFVICIDEFQNIAAFGDPVGFQKKLRSHWQKHQYSSYCLYGSKRHMMLEVFASPSMPFYKFGDIMFLQKISEKDWVKFITKRFSDTGKKISNEDAALIASLVECHPYYVQQLAQLSWLKSKKTCNDQIIMNANEGLILQLSLLFQNLVESLTTPQINFLRALLDGIAQLSSQKTLNKYELGTSGNVIRIKEALINKEIIDIQGSDISFLDPVFKQWLKKFYFKQ